MNYQKFIKKVGFDHIEFNHSYEGREDQDPSSQEEELFRTFMTRIVGVQDGEGEEEERVDLGYVTSTLLLYGYAMNTGRDIIDEADAISGDLYFAAKLLYESGGIPEGEGYAQNGLYLNTLFIHPEYRGHGLGALALRRVIEFCDSASICNVVLYPSATSRVSEGDPLFGIPKEVADKKLSEFYQSLGFISFKDTGFLYLNLESYNYQWVQGRSIRSPLIKVYSSKKRVA